MLPEGILEEVKTVMQQYRGTLSPGVYVFAPELKLGKMTGKIIEQKSDHPDDYVPPAGLGVTFGFHPLGFVPASLKGAPPSWLSGYPFLPSLEKLAEAPGIFLVHLKRHVEKRMRLTKREGFFQPAEPVYPTEISTPKDTF